MENASAMFNLRTTRINGFWEDTGFLKEQLKVYQRFCLHPAVFASYLFFLRNNFFPSIVIFTLIVERKYD